MQSSLRHFWGSLESRLDALPPFWTVFALTLVETVGEGVLAIPIAVSKIGPVAGIVILVILGLVNVLTIAAIAEASARNGSIRYGEAYIGHVVQDYLGAYGSLILGLGVAIVQFQALLSYMVGFATTLEAAIHIPAEFWAFLIFVICFYFVRRGSFDSTVAFALIIGLINVVIILVLSLMTLSHIQWANFSSSISILGKQEFDLTVLNIVFGVIFSAYLGHLGVSNSAQVVLRRDTSARSLLWGSMAAQATLMALYCLWVFAVNGAISHDVLAQESGTALVPLAAELGPIVHWLGAILIILGIGMSSIVTALGLFWLVREALPVALEGEDLTFMGVIWSRLFSHQGRFWIAASPILFLFGLVEWQLWHHQESFTEPLSFLGVIAAPLLAGLFPVLLLLASRRKGDRPITAPIQFLGKPMIACSIYGLFLLNLFVHGLIIWQHPIERGAALIIGVMMLIAPVVFWLRGAFAPRMVVEIRQEGRHTHYSIVANGHSVSVPIQLTQLTDVTCFESCEGTLPPLASIQHIQFDLSHHPARELKVWLHRVTATHDSELLFAQLELFNGQATQTLDVADHGGQIVFPIHRKGCYLKLTELTHTPS